MARDVPEADWKLFRELREAALERFCERVLHEAEGLTRASSRTAHERYQDLFQLLKERDLELARAFDDPRRSRMVEQLAVMRMYHLFGAGELGRFSSETRAAVDRVAEAIAD